MSILIDKNTRVITQGITGKTGQFHTRMCRDYANGKNCFVAGVNPKKAGENFEGVPIYATVAEAKAGEVDRRVDHLRLPLQDGDELGDLLLQAAVLSASEKLSNAETFAAITCRAAQALRFSDRGVLAEKKICDMIAFDSDDFREILYHQGKLKPSIIWKKGLRFTLPKN